MLDSIRQSIEEAKQDRREFSEIYLEYVCNVQDELIEHEVDQNSLKLEQDTASINLVRTMNKISDSLKSII